MRKCMEVREEKTGKKAGTNGGSRVLDVQSLKGNSRDSGSGTRQVLMWGGGGGGLIQKGGRAKKKKKGGGLKGGNVNPEGESPWEKMRAKRKITRDNILKSQGSKNLRALRKDWGVSRGIT